MNAQGLSGLFHECPGSALKAECGGGCPQLLWQVLELSQVLVGRVDPDRGWTVSTVTSKWESLGFFHTQETLTRRAQRNNLEEEAPITWMLTGTGGTSAKRKLCDRHTADSLMDRGGHSIWPPPQTGPISATLVMTRPIKGPREIQLDLEMITVNTVINFRGSSVIRLRIYVSQYPF
ncbi:hypothetical protein P7K49_018484 [Saguinus oedipus]|uniref:Fibulin C-terminal Ig-like domain-containing protein n=1 Tax=Saguinus oedipus TaxID=9490 RepID=A0ABQ9V5H7_SAGOE|nr:hypothetical protein P7K49_018484 [Saguinus oedipus]